MTIGPDPMMRTDLRSDLRGIAPSYAFLASERALALRFSRSFFARWRSFFQRVFGRSPLPMRVASLVSVSSGLTVSSGHGVQLGDHLQDVVEASREPQGPEPEGRGSVQVLAGCVDEH